MLIYQYHENKSLDQLFFASERIMTCTWTGLPDSIYAWEQQEDSLIFNEEPMARIVHRDVKASNILLDATLCPKISDFGLVKLYDDNKTHFSTHNIAGTREYLAPEYALWEQLREKADVFSFGIVALEIVSGKPNFFNNRNNEETYLLDWLMKSNQILELLDPSLAEFVETEVTRMIRVALLCTRASPTVRPPMSRVVSMHAYRRYVSRDCNIKVKLSHRL